MATARLVPLNVTAKIVEAETTIPTLDGGVFNRDSRIEPGIHLHWALPDALIRATVVGNGPDADIFFPGVPDLWLVLRFNPPAASPTRSWRAWVVDAFARTATPLDAWTFPARNEQAILTATGVLPAAADAQRPGWGRWPKTGTTFDPATVAYYPACRNRFGFHDALADLGGTTGNLTYTVVGWYALPGHDPLLMNPSPEAGVVDRKLGNSAKVSAASFSVLGTTASLKATAPRRRWQPRSLRLEGQIDDRLAHVAAASPSVTGSSSVSAFATMDKFVREVVELFPSSDPATGVNATEAADGLTPDTAPQTIVCHGSIFGVPLGSAPAAPPDFMDGQVHLYPSVKRAMAEVAARNATDKRVDILEMLLQNLEAKRNATSEIVDLPGAAHELTFQSVPGQSTFYARLEVASTPVNRRGGAFSNNEPGLGGRNRPGGGHMPFSPARAAAYDPPDGNAPTAVWRDVPDVAPSSTDITNWIAEVRAALAAVVASAAAAGRRIDGRFIRVQDYRPQAQPFHLGRASDGAGPDQAGWWLDADSDAELRDLFEACRAARVRLPVADHLYEAAGARWHRPWAPTMVVYGAKRSYRFGFDDRFSPDGNVATRNPGQFLAAMIAPGRQAVLGRSLLANPDGLRAPGLPLIIRPLAAEAALLDEDNAALMAAAAGVPVAAAEFRTAVQAQWLKRKQDLTDQARADIAKVGLAGELPSPIAFTRWEDPRDPVLIDTNYSHPHSSIEDDWELQPDRIECTRRVPRIVMPPDVVTLEERTRVNYSVVKTLKSQLVTRVSIGPTGQKTITQTPPPGVNAFTYEAIDIVSAPLTQFDPGIFDQGLRERTGFLHLNRFEVVDTYGFRRSWHRGDGPIPSGEPPPSYVTELHPRLPYWSRLHFRLQSAAEADDEATVSTPPVIGILLPDLLEHALEVYDGEGHAIGQISSPRPLVKSEVATTLQSRFEVHPWVAAALGLSEDADPLDAIPHPILRGFVAALVTHQTEVPANVRHWYETAATAFLRVTDTVRSTLDPARVTPHSKARLIGEPILLLAARLHLEATSAEEPRALTNTPPVLGDEPELPTVSIRVGDVTRPDDGVLGCFELRADPLDSRFVPVVPEAAAHGIVNALSEFVTTSARTAEHPFIAQGRGTTFALGVNHTKDLVIVADPRGGLYATSGILPRKRITMPEEFIMAAFRNLEPTFPIGPVLAAGSDDHLRPLVPPPRLEGYRAEFIYRTEDEPGQQQRFPRTSLPPVPPDAELPTTRATLAGGWIRVAKKAP